jgi:hypothetical protein
VVVTGTLTVIVIIVWAAVVNTLRMGADYPLPQTLPFCSGKPPHIYDFVGCAVLAISLLSLLEILSSPRQKKDEGRRFRHSLWLIPLSLTLAGYIRTNVKPSVHWQSLVDQLNIPDPERFSSLCVLLSTCTAILLVAHIWQRR